MTKDEVILKVRNKDIDFHSFIETYKNTITIKNYEVEEQTIDGITYKVVPVVMMTEGVHVGSHGAILHTAEQLGAIVESWNGIPITYTHPEIDGNFVPANSPEVLEEFGLGRVFNAFMDGDKLRAEAWFDINKLSLFEDLETRINEGAVIEVSVGIFSDEMKANGFWGNESYTAIAYNYRPEHLAILLDDIGACSILDGCGLRVNKNNNEMEKLITNQNREKILKELNTEGIIIGFSVFEEGMQELVDKVRNKLYSLEENNNGTYFYLEEVYPFYLIYRVDNKSISGYYKRSYSVENGKVVFLDDVVQVNKKIEYIPIGDTININLNSTIMSEKKKECTPCVKDKVTALIDNAVTLYQETDREWMEALSLEQLGKIEPIIQEKTVEVEVNKETTPEMAVNILKKEWKTVDDVLKVVPESIKKEFDTAIAIHAKAKENLVTAIMTNTADVWTKETLQGMEVNVLEAIYKTSKIEVNVNKEQKELEDSGVAAGLIFSVNTEGRKDEVMLPKGIKREKV